MTDSSIKVTNEEFEKLKTLALEARDLAYCPYSKFRVGAVILTSNGNYIQGANIENASYGATICAERTACVTAVTAGHKRFKAIAVATDLADACSPCGICRQFIREFAPLSLPIYMFTTKGEHEIMKLEQLLPHSFGPDDLDKDRS